MLPDHVLDEIALRFALGRRLSFDPHPQQGELGRVWRLTTTQGSWAVKELLQPQTEAELSPGAGLQEAAVSAGLPAPAVVRTTDGSVLAEVDGRQFRVLSWVDVRPADVTLDVARVGRLVAALHQLGAPGEGEVDPWYTQPVGPDGWDDLVVRLISAGSPLAADVAGLHDELCRNEELLEPPRTLQPLHLDLWADNVRVTPTGDLCVLDWDNSGLGDPRQELAVVLFEFTSWSPARTRALYAAYVDAGGPARITRAEDFSMAVAQLGHILQWQCQHWLSAETIKGRQHAEAAVRELVARPLTQTVVDRMVESLT